MKNILFIQGLGMTKHEWNNSFDEIAARLTESGFECIQFDLPIFDAEGRCREMSLHARAAFVETIEKKYNPVGLLAQSYGVTTSLVTSLPSVTSQLFVSPALDPMQSLVKVYEEKGVVINYAGDTSLPRSSGENMTVGKKFWEDIRNFDDSSVAGKITIPTYILHGDRDTKIPTETVRSFFNAIPIKQKKLNIYIGGDHGIKDVPRPMREEFLEDVVEWFKKTL